ARLIVALSGRNRLRGFVEGVRTDGLLGQGRLRIGDQTLTAVITSDAMSELKLINQRRWMRVIGDTILAVGCVVLVWFVFGLSTGHSYGPETGRSTEPVSGQPPAYLPAR